MRARIETLSIQSIALTKLKHRNLEESQKYLEVGAEQVRGGVSALSMVSYAGKRTYDDVETDRTPMRSAVEKCGYSGLEENALSAPIEVSDFIEENS